MYDESAQRPPDIENLLDSDDFIDVSALLVNESQRYDYETTAKAELQKRDPLKIGLKIQYYEYGDHVSTVTYEATESDEEKKQLRLNHSDEWENIYSRGDPVITVTAHVKAETENSGYGKHAFISRPAHLQLLFSLLEHYIEDGEFTIVELITDQADTLDHDLDRSGWTSYIVEKYLLGYSKEIGNELEWSNVKTYARVTNYSSKS